MLKVKKSYIGNDLPDEYTGSNYTAKLKGALAKAKANIDMIPDLPFRFLMTMEKFCVIMFYVELVIRHAVDRKLYLYDIINIKKKRVPRLSHKAVRLKTHFLIFII